MKNDGVVKVRGSGSGFKSCTSAPLEDWTRKKRSMYLTVFELRSTKHTGWCSQHKSNYSKILTVVVFYSLSPETVPDYKQSHFILKYPHFFVLARLLSVVFFSFGARDINAARHWLLQFSVTDHILNTCTLDYSIKTARKGWWGVGKWGYKMTVL